MKIIQTLKDRFKRIVSVIVPTQDNIIAVESAANINNSATIQNLVRVIPFKDVKKIAYSSIRNYFTRTEYTFDGGKTATIKINSPAQADFLVLEFFDANGRRVVPYNAEFYTGASGATYPVYQIVLDDNNQPVVRLLYTSSTRGTNEFADILETDGYHSVLFKKNT